MFAKFFMCGWKRAILFYIIFLFIFYFFEIFYYFFIFIYYQGKQREMLKKLKIHCYSHQVIKQLCHMNGARVLTVSD